MKKLLILFLLISPICFAQRLDTDETSPSGRKYILSWKGNEYVTVVYFHGSGQIGKTLDAIRATPFYKNFYLPNKNKYNFVMPLQYAGKAGWEDYKDGKSSGAWFILEMIDRHAIKKIIGTGHSAGATWALATSLQTVLSGWVPVAGRSLDYPKTKLMGANKIPVFAWHGSADNGAQNNITEGTQAVNWYKQGGGVPKFKILDGVGHGSDVYAYRDNEDLEKWIDGLFPPPIDPPKPGIYIDGTFIATDSVTFNGFFIEIRR